MLNELPGLMNAYKIIAAMESYLLIADQEHSTTQEYTREYIPLLATVLLLKNEYHSSGGFTL